MNIETRRYVIETRTIKGWERLDMIERADGSREVAVYDSYMGPA